MPDYVVVLEACLSVVLLISILIALVYHSRHKKEQKRIKKNTDKKGAEGEEKVNSYLAHLIESDEYLLNNLLVPYGRDKATEIDTVIVTHKGIFCIETKNWIGQISGSDEDEYWIQRYSDPSLPTRKHKNPVRQNANHCSILKGVLKSYPIENVVLFLSKEEGSFLSSSYTYSLKEFTRYYHQKNIQIGDPAVLKKIYRQLSPYKASQRELKAHKKELEAKYKN